MYQGRSKSRDDPLALVPQMASLCPPELGPTSFAHNWEQGRIGEGAGQAGRKRHTDSDKRGRQTGQRDSPTYRNQLPVPACGALMPERQRGECGRSGQRQGGREKERVTSGPRKSRNGLEAQPRPTHPALKDPPLHPSIHHPSLTEGCAGATPSAGAAGDALWAASCSVFSCSRRMVCGAGRG